MNKTTHELLDSNEFKEFIDLTHLLHSLEGDIEFIKSILPVFLEEIACSIAQIKKAIKYNDRNMLNQYAHKLNGTLVNVCVVKMTDKIQMLEEASVSARIEDIFEMFDSIEKMTHKISYNLKQLAEAQ